MKENPEKQFAIGKCFFLPVYGDQNIKDLLLRVENCEQQISSISKNWNGAAIQQEITHMRTELRQALDAVGLFSTQTGVKDFYRALNRLQSRVEKLEERIIAFSKSNKSVSSNSHANISDQEKFENYDALLKKIRAVMQRQDKKISDLKGEISAQNDRIRKLEDQVQKMESATSTAAKKTAAKAESNRVVPQEKAVPIQAVQSVKKAETKAMYAFSAQEQQMVIPKRKAISCLFPEGLRDAEYQKLASDAYNYLAMLYQYGKKCEEPVQKVVNLFVKSAGRAKIKIEKHISEKNSKEKSEFCTETYVQAVSNDLSKLLGQCLSQKEECYRQIGTLLIEYLDKIGFYVPEQMEDDVRSEYISTVASYPEITKDRSKHGRIAKFHSLPYMIDYYDENGEVCQRCIQGICTYYKYEV